MINSLFKDYNKKIGLFKLGGIGDSIQSLFLTHALKRKFPSSHLTLFVRDKLNLFHNDNKVDHIIYTGYVNSWIGSAKKQSKNFDIFYDDRYVVGEYHDGKLKKVNGGSKEEYNNVFNYLNSYNEDLLHKSSNNLKVNLKEEDFNLDSLIVNNKLEKIIKKPYIIIHHGYDKLRYTKAYYTSGYNYLIKLLKDKYPNFNFIQVGLKKEPRIKGTIDLRGKTNLEELFSLVRSAKLVITQEGALHHITRGYNTKAVVLFGATPIKCFGYKQNLNINNNLGCEGCFYKTKDWYQNCPKESYQVKFCKSLFKIKPEDIFKGIVSYLN